MFLFSLRRILQLPSFAYKCIFFLYLAINVVWNYFGGVQEGLFFPLMGNSSVLLLLFGDFLTFGIAEQQNCAENSVQDLP